MPHLVLTQHLDFFPKELNSDRILMLKDNDKYEKEA